MHRYVPIAFVGLLAGIAFRSFVDVGFQFFLLPPLIAFTLLCLYRRRHLSFVVLLIFISLGMVRMDVAVPPNVNFDNVGEQIAFIGTVVKDPDEREYYTNLVLESDVFKHRVLVKASTNETFRYGERVSVSGVVEQPQNFEGDTGRVFNYQGYLAKDDIYYVIQTEDVFVVETRTTAMSILLSAKERYLLSLKTFLKEPYAALAGGITVGEKRSLGSELTKKFREAGLIHIVVLSGYNIAIMVIALSALLSFLNPTIRSVAAIILIAVFTVFVGASATVVRAALMGGIAAFGVMARRNYDALHALVVAGCIMVLWNPYVVIYDPSFQLSFVATLGLLLGAPLFLHWLSFIPETFGLRELVVATVVTQIAVLPLLVYMMGEVSLVSLPVNMVVLPFVPLAMLFSFLVGVLGMISGVLTLPFMFVAHYFLRFIVSVVEFGTSVSWAAVAVPNIPFWAVVVSYIILIMLWMKGKQAAS
tara:strand:+ start:1466 stop:2890 length:1425 start_codon:yes stop_codon:yes gene_type:complete